MALFLKRSGGQYPSQQLAQIEILKWKSKQVKILKVCNNDNFKKILVPNVWFSVFGCSK